MISTVGALHSSRIEDVPPFCLIVCDWSFPYSPERHRMQDKTESARGAGTRQDRGRPSTRSADHWFGMTPGFRCHFDQGRRPPYVISTKAEGRAEKSGREWTARRVRGQMSRLRCTAKAQHLVFLASIFGCGRRPRRAPLDITDGAGLAPNRHEPPKRASPPQLHFLSRNPRYTGVCFPDGGRLYYPPQELLVL